MSVIIKIGFIIIYLIASVLIIFFISKRDSKGSKNFFSNKKK